MKQFISFLIVAFYVSIAFAAPAWFPEGIQTKGSSTIGEKSTAAASSVLDIRSTTKGMLAPRMTTAQRTVISAPATGLLVYDTDTKTFWQYNGTAWAEVGSGGSGSAQYNLLTNYGFEDATFSTDWTASGGTLAAAAGSNILFNSQGATWDSGAASQTLSYAAITVPQGYKGNNCEGAIYAQTPSGTATHLVQAYDGTNILVSATIVSSTTPRLNTVNFPCPQSGTVALRIISVAADEPLIAIDDAYLGLARNVGSTQLISEWVSYTPTIGLTGGSTTAYGKYRRVGDSVEVQFDATFTTVFTGGTGSVSLPSVCSAIDTAKLPTGYAVGVGLPNSNLRLFDVSAGQWGGSIVYNDTTTVLMRVWTDDVGAGGNHVQVDAVISTTTPFTWVNNDRVSGYFKVPCVGWTAQTIVMPDAQGWWAGASIVGAAASLSTSTQASFTEITNAGLTLTPTGGSATIGIACASGTTNTAGATTCAAAAESLGVTVSVPVSGAYRVCTSAANFMEDAGAATNVNALQTFKVNLTTAASSTVVTSGDATAHAALKTNSGGGGEVIGGAHPFSVCSIFQLSAGGNTFRLMYSSSISGTLATNTIDASGGVSQNVSFRIEPVSQQQQAVLANSVSTGTTNGERIGRATIANSGSASITSQSTGFLSSVSYVSTGVVDTFFTAGYFSAAPSCTCTARLGGRLCSIDNTAPPSISGARFWTGAANTATEANIEFQIICIGPR